MAQRSWLCEGCGVRSNVGYHEHADVLTVLYIIEDDHMAKSPECPIPVMGLRIVNEDYVSPA